MQPRAAGDGRAGRGRDDRRGGSAAPAPRERDLDRRRSRRSSARGSRRSTASPTPSVITAWPSWTPHGSRCRLPSAGQDRVALAGEERLRGREHAGVARRAAARAWRRSPSPRRDVPRRRRARRAARSGPLPSRLERQGDRGRPRRARPGARELAELAAVAREQPERRALGVVDGGVVGARRACGAGRRPAPTPTRAIVAGDLARRAGGSRARTRPAAGRWGRRRSRPRAAPPRRRGAGSRRRPCASRASRGRIPRLRSRGLALALRREAPRARWPPRPQASPRPPPRGRGAPGG